MHHNHQRLVVKDSCLVLQPSLVQQLGRSTALILQQIHYWVSSPHYGKIHEGQRWIYNSYDAWADNIKVFSVSTIRRSIKKLEDLGILKSSSLSSKKSDRTKWYTINLSKIDGIDPTNSTIKTNTSSVQNEMIYKETKKTYKNKYSYKKKEGEGAFEQTIPEKQHLTQDMSKTTATDMLTLWCDIVRQKDIVMTQTLAIKLENVFKKAMHQDMNQWKKYCAMIASSPYLMGHSFKLNLFWALHDTTIQRIFSHDLGVKDVEDQQPLDLEKKATDHIIHVDEDEKCRHLRRWILKYFGAGVYLSWFKVLHLAIKGNDIIVQGPSRFHEDYVRQHFLVSLLKS